MCLILVVAVIMSLRMKKQRWDLHYSYLINLNCQYFLSGQRPHLSYNLILIIVKYVHILKNRYTDELKNHDLLKKLLLQRAIKSRRKSFESVVSRHEYDYISEMKEAKSRQNRYTEYQLIFKIRILHVSMFVLQTQ